ncbi:MAG TPA: hypothetical protein VMP08_11065 [Anaerolineae bacterium]|nr:hypothetical protein [Anaerolineae bacterium]
MPNSPPVQGVHEPVHAQLFMLRIWLEDLGAGHSEWRGKVQHVPSGEARYFRDWPALVACLQAMLNDQTDQI